MESPQLSLYRFSESLCISSSFNKLLLQKTSDNAVFFVNLVSSKLLKLCDKEVIDFTVVENGKCSLLTNDSKVKILKLGSEFFYDLWLYLRIKANRYKSKRLKQKMKAYIIGFFIHVIDLFEVASGVSETTVHAAATNLLDLPKFLFQKSACKNREGPY